MQSSSLQVSFYQEIPKGTVVTQIKREFVWGGISLRMNFKTDITIGTLQKQIKRQFRLGGIPINVSFKTGIPKDTAQKQIKREFLPGGIPLGIRFAKGIPQSTQAHEIWRFVKWTIGGMFNEKYCILRTIEKPFITIEPLPILPKLRGQSYPDKKRPEYHTIIKQSPSGTEKRFDSWQFPRWYIELTYDFLEGDTDGTDFKRLLDFFAARHGSLEDFWYRDPDDNRTKNELIGIGDGKTKSYQLCRTYCGRLEPIFAVDTNYDFDIMFNGEKQSLSKFSVTNSGVVNFKTEVPEGIRITASFHYYYRCRFTEDIAEFEQFAHKLWTIKSLSMVTTL